MALTDSLCFDIVGSLITSQGIIPTFTRYTPANAESQVNGTWRIFGVSAHQPRFSSTGAILLEKGATNLVSYPLDLTNSTWVKGSSIQVLPDRVQALDNNYLADLISVAVYTGNTAAQTLTKTISMPSGADATCSVYLSLLGGRFGPNDVVTISGAGVLATQTVALASIYNDRVGNYIPITLNFKTAGTFPSDLYDAETTRSVQLQLYVEKAVSIAWGGAQIEYGTCRTSFIGQEAELKSRDQDYLNYPTSPVAGLDSFLFYANLEYWKQDGIIVSAGNFKVEIVGGKVRATCGVVTATDPDALPVSAKIAVRVSRGLERVQLYVNGVLKVKEILTGYTANVSTLTVGGEGSRLIRCLYFFNRDVADGSIDVGKSVLSDMLLLHEQDSLLVDLAEGYSRIVFPSLKISAGGEASVRFPQFQFARQAITSITTGSGKTAQVDRVTVQTIVSASAAQTDFVVVNGTQYKFTSDATPTTAEIAAGLAAAINATPRTQPVTATYTSGASFTITADVAGDDFGLSVSDRLAKESVTANAPDTNTVNVSNAVDFARGRVQVFRDYVYICDLNITAINTGTNVLTVTAVPNSLFALVRQGDILMQPSWSLQVGANNYFAHHLEDFPDVKVTEKSLDGFKLRNTGLADRNVSPYAKVTL